MKKPVCATLNERNIDNIDRVATKICEDSKRGYISRSETLDVILDAFWSMYGLSADNIVVNHFNNGYDKDDRRKSRKMPSRKGISYKTRKVDSLPPY